MRIKKNLSTIIFHYFNFTSLTLITRQMGFVRCAEHTTCQAVTKSAVQKWRHCSIISVKANRVRSRSFFSTTIFANCVYQATDHVENVLFVRRALLERFRALQIALQYPDWITSIFYTSAAVALRSLFAFQKIPDVALHMNRLSLELGKLAPFFRNKWSRHPSNNFYYY